MIPLSIDEIIQSTESVCLRGTYEGFITSVCTDSRKAGPGALFVALKGQRFDGRDFIPSVCELGAAAVICADFAPEQAALLPGDTAILCVSDTLTALGQIAQAVRRKLDIPVVGVTGSVGKTSTKDLVAAALGSVKSTAKTQLNFNNEIGLPMTVFSVTPEHEALVGEMGMRGLGEIAYLSDILRPDIGIITNVGVSHIERLGSRENIFLAKTEICTGMPEHGILLLNGDDFYTGDRVRAAARLSDFSQNIRPLWYGMSENCDFTASDIQPRDDGKMSFLFRSDYGDRAVHLQVPGRHNVLNASAALAAAVLCGVPLEDAVNGVETYTGDSVRQNILRGSGITVIDDTYNAGPESMQASLDVLADLPDIQRRIAVLGDMLELGENSASLHRAVGVHAAEKNIQILITVGAASSQIEAGFRDIRPDAPVYHCDCTEEAGHILQRLLRKGDGLLVKGSHAMHMDEIVNVLKEEFLA